MIVVLGNRDAASAQFDAEGRKSMAPLEPAKRATTAIVPDEWTLAQAFRALTDGDGVINNHFADGATPVWVASDNEALAELISENFGGIEIRALELEDSTIDLEVTP